MSNADAKARARGRRWVARNPGWAKEWRNVNPGKATEITRAYLERNPVKRSAHIAVGNAIRDGKLSRPDSCAVCGDKPLPNARGASRIEAHHVDYTKALEVIWLCKPCHKRAHRKEDQYG